MLAGAGKARDERQRERCDVIFRAGINGCCDHTLFAERASFVLRIYDLRRSKYHAPPPRTPSRELSCESSRPPTLSSLASSGLGLAYGISFLA